MVFASLLTCTILTTRVQQAEIVASNEILGQVDDGLRQTDLTVMIGRLFADVSDQLGHLWPLVPPHLEFNKIEQTLISFFILRLKQAHMTFLCPGFNPSATQGIERMLSAIENKISSLLMNSEYGISSNR